MVGPAYSLMDIYPPHGPVTGGTKLELIGLDFVNSSDVLVRFEWEGHHEKPGDAANNAAAAAVALEGADGLCFTLRCKLAAFQVGLLCSKF